MESGPANETAEFPTFESTLLQSPTPARRLASEGRVVERSAQGHASRTEGLKDILDVIDILHRQNERALGQMRMQQSLIQGLRGVVELMQ